MRCGFNRPWWVGAQKEDLISRLGNASLWNRRVFNLANEIPGNNGLIIQKKKMHHRLSLTFT
jgi:hypothetical protein